MNLKHVSYFIVLQICVIVSKKVLNPESNRTLLERNLITSTIDKLSILENHNRYYRNTTLRNFKNIVLGYVTPWNIYGYTIAKKFANKFTHISPVWYELKNNKLKLIDNKVKTQNDFIRNLREKNKQIKIFPRIQIQDVWNQKSNANEIAAIIEKERLVKKVNGFVFEKFVQTETQLKIIHDISKLLKKAGCEIILVVAPFRNDAKNFLLTESLLMKYPSFVAYSLMTYDYSSAEKPGPNSPLKWATKNVQRMAKKIENRSKILLGLNMYGYRYLLEGGTSAIKGSEYIQYLKANNVSLHYDDVSIEHYIQHNGETIYYPSVYSIKKRIDEATELGTGLALWELGQGLDYFYDLL